MKNFGTIAKPLTYMLKNDSFIWSPESMTAFDALKSALISAPVLALPDFSKKFVVEIDASGKGLGAVLMQEQHPIAYISKSLGPTFEALLIFNTRREALIQLLKHFLVRRGRIATTFVEQCSVRIICQYSEGMTH